MTYDSDFYENEIADAEAQYNALAQKACDPNNTFSWDDGVELHEAYMELQLAREALARYEESQVDAPEATAIDYDKADRELAACNKMGPPPLPPGLAKR